MHNSHTTLAAGKWHELSLFNQMANIGSEVSRALRWRDKDENIYNAAISRAFDLLYLTIQDQRWRGRLKELARVRELLRDAVLGGEEYKSSLEDLDRYFFHFALAARLHT